MKPPADTTRQKTMPTLAARRAPWAVAVVALVAFGLRLIRLDAQSLWFDEGWSWYITTGSWARLIRLLALDNQPPLYYALLKVWMVLAGDSDLSLRFLSVLAGTATVPFVYALGRRFLRDPTLATVAALLMAISPPHVIYSQEVRMYAWAILLGGLSVYLALRWSQRPDRKTIAGYILVATAVLYTSYFGILAIAFANVAVLFHAVFERHHRTLRSWLVAQVVVLLLLVPLAPLISASLSHHYAWRPTLNCKEILMDAWWSLTTGGPQLPTWRAGVSVPLALGLLAVGWLGIVQRPQGKRGALLMLLYLAIPVALLTGLSQWRPIYAGRYVLHSLLPLALLAGAGCVTAARIIVNLGRRLNLPGRLTNVVAALGAVCLGLLSFGLPFERALNAYYFNPAYAREDFRAVAAHVQSQEKPGQTLILLNSAYPFLRYYDGHLPWSILPADFDRVRDEQEVVTALNELIKAPSWVWLVGWQWDIADPQNLIEGQLRQHGSEIGQQWWSYEGPRQPIRLSAYDIVSSDFQVERRNPLDVSFGDGDVRLVGYRVEGQPEPGRRVFLTLWWELNSIPSTQYHAFAHLLSDRTWPPVVAGHDKPPLNDFYPFRIWPLHEAVQDIYVLELADTAPPPPYELEVGLYDPASGTRLAVTQDERAVGDRVVLPWHE